MGKIKSDMSIYEIISTYPETKEVFAANGFEIFLKEDVVKNIGSFLKLKTALKTKEINLEIFINILEEKIESENKFTDIGALSKEANLENLNFLGLLPCPLVVPFKNEFEAFINSINKEQGVDFKYSILGNANNQLDYNEYIDNFTDIDEVPDIILSPGLNSFFNKKFVDNFIKKDFFVDVSDYAPNKCFAELGFQDPQHHYSMISMNFLVMIVDKNVLGDIKEPRSFEDLLKPEYEKKVAIRGKNGTFCDVVLSNFYKDFGDEGIKKLARSVKFGIHPAEMVKYAGSGKAEAPAVSILPYFYSELVKNKKNVSVVIPKEGALVSPVFMLVKKSKLDKLKEIADFLAGPKIGQIFAGAYFSSVNPQVDNGLPKGIKFKWLGWDYIKDRDMGAVVDKINGDFLKAYNGGDSK